MSMKTQYYNNFYIYIQLSSKLFIPLVSGWSSSLAIRRLWFDSSFLLLHVDVPLGNTLNTKLCIGV